MIVPLAQRGRRFVPWLLVPVVLAGIATGYRLAARRPTAEPPGQFLENPRVIADIVTYLPLLDDLDLLEGEDGIDFTALTDSQWAVLEGTDAGPGKGNRDALRTK